MNEQKWRHLKDQEMIAQDDEWLALDCETWEPVLNWQIGGLRWHLGLMPCRRLNDVNVRSVDGEVKEPVSTWPRCKACNVALVIKKPGDKPGRLCVTCFISLLAKLPCEDCILCVGSGIVSESSTCDRNCSLGWGPQGHRCGGEFVSCECSMLDHDEDWEKVI